MTIHEDLANAMRAGGAAIVDVAPASGRRNSPNPTLISVRAGPRRLLNYQLYAWRITGEGKGRVGTNFRVQGTSFGSRNSTVKIDSTVLGVGWSPEFRVYVGFDPWIKRNPGASSSVHIKRQLLVDTHNAEYVDGGIGYVEGGEDWDPRLGFSPSRAASFIPWAQGLWSPKTVPVIQVEHSVVDSDHSLFRVDPVRSRRAYGVRTSDRLQVFDAPGDVHDDYLWRVQEIETLDVSLPSKRNRFHFIFACERSARIRRT